jgi:tryptophan synthase alpha chain
MSTLDAVFAKCRSTSRPAFIPFITAGDPSLDATGQFVDTLVNAGADIVEVGFPYSDPLADGPVIQASYTRALAAGTKLNGIFPAVANWTSQFPDTPFVAMVSYSLILRRGPEAFLDACRHAGFAGFIVPDLPHEEGVGLVEQASRRGISLIRLVTPTTTPERAAEIIKTTTGFLYVVSVTGITGARSALSMELAAHLKKLRAMTPLPLCVGFGISTPEQVRALYGLADGVIVGSAIVRCLEGQGSVAQKQQQLHQVTTALLAAS